MRKIIWVLILILLLGMACLPLGMVGCGGTPKNATDREIDIIIAEEMNEGALEQVVFCVEEEQLTRFNVTKEEVAIVGRALIDAVGEAMAEAVVDIWFSSAPEGTKEEKENGASVVNKEELRELFREGFYCEIRRLEGKTHKVVRREKMKWRISE